MNFVCCFFSLSKLNNIWGGGWGNGWSTLQAELGPNSYTPAPAWWILATIPLKVPGHCSLDLTCDTKEREASGPCPPAPTVCSLLGQKDTQHPHDIKQLKPRIHQLFYFSQETF